MEKILVPIDFSASSSWGFYYAYYLAQQFGSELIVAHLYRPPYVESTMPVDMIRKIIHDKEQGLLKHMKANTQAPLEFPTKEQIDRVKVRHMLESAAELTLADIANNEGVDLIVMGTHGAGGAMDKVWGTNTSKVIKEAKCPVLAIPSGVDYKGISRIAYATDFDPEDIDKILQMAFFATAVGAEVNCVHVNVVGEEEEVLKEEAFKEAFAKKFENLPVTYTVCSAITVEDGLETFLRINHISILAMLTHKKSLWDRLFNNKSMTKSMALRTQIPLLAFHA
ncbi:MAG: universal stress protein [Aureispira sp.]|nr:universal stress protein [Aureispira sp.]